MNEGRKPPVEMVPSDATAGYWFEQLVKARRLNDVKRGKEATRQLRARGWQVLAVKPARARRGGDDE